MGFDFERKRKHLGFLLSNQVQLVKKLQFFLFRCLINALLLLLFCIYFSVFERLKLNFLINMNFIKSKMGA